MHVAGVAIMILVIVAAVVAFAYGLLKTYIDKRDSNAIISFVSTIAVSVTLLCVMIIPVDIYIVSSDLNSDGSQSNPDLTQQSTNAIQSVYYALYILLLIFAFLVLPFFYFYFEEDSEDATIGRKACSAFKYMIGFVIFFVVLLALGLVLRKGKRDDDTDWRDKLSNDFTHGEAVLSFCIGCLSCFGLCGYVIYAGYGLARMPLKLLSRAKVSPPTPLIGTDAQSRTGLLDAHRRREAKEAKRHIPLSDVRQEDIDLSLRRNHENIQYLQSQYDLSARPWSKEDRKQMDELKREQRRLQSVRQSKLRTGGAKGRRVGGNDDLEELTCWDKCWNILQPIRLVIAIPLILLSLLLIISLTITVIDKFEHSSCGPSCGYELSSPKWVNPIDEALKGLNKVFPIDCLAFGGLVMYIFLACVSGIVGLGVRFFIFHLYSIQKGRTMPNGYLMMAWLLQLIVLALNMEVLTIAPTYASFGNQFYLNTTSNERHSCDIDLIGIIPNTCIQTSVGRFITTMGVETPFFTVILFYGNLAFVGFFLLFLIHGLTCADNSKKEEVDAFRKLDELSD